MRKVLAAILMAMSTLSVSGVLLDKADAQTAETIRQIRIEGNQRIEDRTVQSYLLVSPGEPFEKARFQNIAPSDENEHGQ